MQLSWQSKLQEFTADHNDVMRCGHGEVYEV